MTHKYLFNSYVLIVISLLIILLTILCAPIALAQPTYTVLHSFTGWADGRTSYSGLVRDAAGNIYGTTWAGGLSFNCWNKYWQDGCGVVFKLGPTGRETVLHSFSGPVGDGAKPWAGLILDAAGNLYGTTFLGGAYDAGMVFKLDSAGHETVLHAFGGADGAAPFAGLVLDSAGNLYGTTYGGGAYQSNGVVFKLDPAGNETVLCSFTGGADGARPRGSLILDSAGNLYGTTEQGGAYGNGVVFKLDPAGNETVLHAFQGTDGISPFARLFRDATGNLYGTTLYGGDLTRCFNIGCGVVFKLDPAGNETVLYTFTGGLDGAFPEGDLVQDAVGNFYGTAPAGGVSGWGVVFKLDQYGNETVLHNFTGENPYAGVVLDAAGNLYGTTAGGTPYGYGVVFKIKMHQ